MPKAMLSVSINASFVHSKFGDDNKKEELLLSRRVEESRRKKNGSDSSRSSNNDELSDPKQIYTSTKLFAFSLS